MYSFGPGLLFGTSWSKSDGSYIQSKKGQQALSVGWAFRASFGTTYYIVPKLSRFFQDILQVLFQRQEMALVMWSKNVYQICEKNCLSISCEQKIRIEGPGIVRHFFFTYLIYIFWSHHQRHLLSWKQNLQNVLEKSWKFWHYIYEEWSLDLFTMNFDKIEVLW